MKKKFAAVILTLATILACSLPAMALPQPQAYQVGAPSGICQDGENLLVTDVYNKVIWRFSGDEASLAAGRIGVSDVNGTPIGGYVDGTLEKTLFMEPWAIAPYLNGYAVTDADANVVRYIADKTVQTIAGTGKEDSKNGTGTAAGFYRPTGIAAGADGELYVADTGNGTIRRISNKGEVTTWFSGLSEPTGLCWANGTLYVAETGSHCIVKIAHGSRTVVAGVANVSGCKDGPAEKSLLRAPLGVAVGPDGAIYIADTGNSAVRCVKNGRVITLASGQLTPEAPAQPRSLLVQDDKLLVTDALAAVVLELPLTTTAYSDVAVNSVFAPFITAATERGLTSGTGAGRFSPNTPVNRGMFVTMLGRMHRSTNGDEVINGSASFSDVVRGSVYEPSINWCAEQGLVLGSNGLFLPNNGITRQDLVTILYRYARQNGYSTTVRGDLSSFKDAAAVSDYAKDAMSWAVGMGLLSGNTNGQLDPVGAATRAHTVKILVNFMDVMGI